MIPMLWAATALAGQLYVNGTAIDPSQIAGHTLEKVDVSVDAQGNILINAPGYRIEVDDGSNPPRPAAATTGTVSDRPDGTQPVSNSAVPKATWWLVTEDNGSRGHTVEVMINQQLAQTVRSGDAQKIVDLGAYLKLGSNAITMRSNSQGASGGTLYVFIGSGDDKSGTVVMDDPKVQFGLGASRTGAYQRDYTLQVN